MNRYEVFITLLYVILLGIVEGITEWLPISSTAHLIILERLFRIENHFKQEFLILLDVVIQLGAILSVVTIYFKKLYPFGYYNEYSKSTKICIYKYVIISMIPILVFGIILDDIVIKYFYNLLTISIMLIFYGVLFITLEAYNKNQNKIIKVQDIGTKKSFIIGTTQVLAIVPGTSRSGVTILSSGILGLSRENAIEYSFFLSIPIMFGASTLKLVKYLSLYSLTLREVIILLIAMMVAMIVSLFMIKKLLQFIKRINFKVFGYYRIALGIIILMFLYF